MIIDPPGSVTQDDAERIDITQGAVIFDPWPFKEAEVMLTLGHRYVKSTAISSGETMAWGLNEDDNVLCTTTHGHPCVTNETAWNEAKGNQ